MDCEEPRSRETSAWNFVKNIGDIELELWVVEIEDDQLSKIITFEFCS